MVNTVSKIIFLTVFLTLIISSVVSAKTVNLAWDPSPDTNVTGYKIYYTDSTSSLPFDGSGANEGASPIDVGSNLSSGLTGLPDAQVHYFAVTAYDATGNESIYSNVVTSDAIVVIPNRSPVLSTIGSKSTVENNNLTFVVNASDADGDSLSYSASSLPSGASFNPSTRTFSWTPGYTQSGSYSVNFSVSDGSLSDSETVTISVGNANRSPELSSIGSKSVVENNNLTFTVSGSDVDGDSLTYSASGLPSGANFNTSTRTFSWTPNIYQSGNYVVTFNVSDGSLSDSEMVAINVENSNQAPVLSAIGSKTVSENNYLGFTISGSDVDGDSLTYSVSSLPAGASFNSSTKTFSWTPNITQSGNYVVTFIVSDGSLSDSEMVAINVSNSNQAPVLSSISAKEINEGETQYIPVSANDADGDSLTYSASNLPTGAVFNAESKLFYWTPDFTQSGTYSVNFHVSDGSLSDSLSVAITVTDVNRAPVLSNIGTKSVVENSSLNFTISASDSDGDNLTYSASNLPNGATFSSASKAFNWVPNSSQAGSYSVTFSVSDGSMSDLEMVTISVEDNASLDSDGDGVADSADAFPQDPDEWKDTDLDGIGNNADSDDDNDGVSDEADSSPLDPSASAWIINAVAGEGGSISPAGESLLDYGGAQIYSMVASSGFSISDVLVDGVSVGPVAEYIFVAVNKHHSIEVVFQESNDGLSLVAAETGLAGVDRVDGGDDSNNYVDGSPKGDLDYVFQIVLQDTSGEELLEVMLVLNGYAYQMTLESGHVESGATYKFITRLGPASSHNFHFETRDTFGDVVSRFPEDSELQGPLVELMNGKNIVGIPGNIASEQLYSVDAFGSSLAYRWIPSEKRNGSYEQVDSGAPVTSGEGYVIKRSEVNVLPSMVHFGQNSAEEVEISVGTGWNLIANPYAGNIQLSEVQVQVGDSSPVSWADAASSLVMVDGVYYYAGKDWGNNNIFESGDGEQEPILIPHVGYWIYVNSVGESVSLILSKPQQ